MIFRFLFTLGFVLLLTGSGEPASDYKQALTKSILYFEAQRSGKLPSNQRATWRADSALRDGSDAGTLGKMSVYLAVLGASLAEIIVSLGGGLGIGVDELERALVDLDYRENDVFFQNIETISRRRPSGNLQCALTYMRDLVGGYYDSGDNVKFGFPLAFTITTLSWGVVEFRNQLAAAGELHNAQTAVRWGTDYLLKAHTAAAELYVEVGDGSSDHSCWQRPEDMTTPRTSYKIDASHPGSDVAGETAAAMAAGSIALRPSDPQYAANLLNHAKQLFDFARNHPGLYQNSVPVAGQFYSSSGSDDELLWAAAWLHRATADQSYLNFIAGFNNNGGVRSMFSWDDKFVGAQVLITKLVLEKKVANSGNWIQYKSNADQFICSVLQKGSNNVKISPGGILWFQPWNNLQYTTAAMLVLAAHADHLSSAKTNLQCPSGVVSPNEMIDFVGRQVDYILGKNPKRMSYMVGFGQIWPSKVHHRGASIISVRKDWTPVDCKGGFDKWFHSPNPNPNVIEGAIVGGPDASDGYSDDRGNYQQAEPATVTTAAIVGVLARLT